MPTQCSQSEMDFGSSGSRKLVGVLSSFFRTFDYG
jgi:hypothetical protein